MTQVEQIAAARIELLESRAHIADLIHRYARCVRTGDASDCLNLFTEHATFEVRQATVGDPDSVVTRSLLTSRAAIIDYLGHGGAAAASVCPLISNLLIDVDGLRATSNCVMTAIVWANGQSVIGEYDDVFVHDGNWRFVSRRYTILRAHG